MEFIGPDHPLREFVTAIERGERSVGETIDTVFQRDAWQRLSATQKPELLQYFADRAGALAETVAAFLAEKYPAFFGGADAEDVLRKEVMGRIGQGGRLPTEVILDVLDDIATQNGTWGKPTKRDFDQCFRERADAAGRLDALSPVERFLFFYGGLKTEDALHHMCSDTHPEVPRRALTVVLDAYAEADGRSAIMANAYYLFAAEVLDDPQAHAEGGELLQHTTYLGRAERILPEDAQLELKILVFSLAGSAKMDLANWTRRVSLGQFRALGDVATPLQLVNGAIADLRTALRLCDPATHRHVYAPTLVELGEALLFDSPAPQDRLEEAREALEKAITLPQVSLAPLFRGMAYHDLGMVYDERSLGDRAQNVRASISHYEEALKYRTRQATPYEWSTTISNLGTSYSDRPDHDIEENAREAVHCYEQALEVRTRQAYPYDWAFTTRSLATVYAERGKERGNVASPKGSRDLGGADLDKARALMLSTLEVFTPEVHPTEWASTLTNLGIVCYELYRIDSRREDFENAIAYVKQARPVAEKSNRPTYVRTLATLLDMSMAAGDPLLGSSTAEIAALLERLLPDPAIPQDTGAHARLTLGKYYQRKLKR